MNEPYLTVALLIIVVCNLGVVWLYLRLHDGMNLLQDDSLIRLVLHRLSSSADRERKILQRIAQVKTRLADEEREDQDRKRRERAKA